MKKKILSLVMTLALTLTFTACGGNGNAQVTTADETTTAQTTEETAAEATEATTAQEAELPEATVNVAVLSGPTGIGAAKLMSDSEKGETDLNYSFTVETDNANVVAALTAGTVDIAAIATNVAANLYNKTSGGVQIAAINTLGVLYILENGDTVKSMADLKGKTIYTTGQGANPEYVLNYLLRENGLEPGTDVQIEFTTADDVTAKMISGEASVCMLPVPAATALSQKSEPTNVVLNLTEEWAKLENGSTLTMGAIVVRKEFAEQNPEAVNAFLAEYSESIDYVKNNAAEAAELVAGYKITPNAVIAEAAIPDCNLVCVTGADEIRVALSGYYDVLFAASPESLGGKLPGDDFYFAA